MKAFMAGMPRDETAIVAEIVEAQDDAMRASGLEPDEESTSRRSVAP